MVRALSRNGVFTGLTDFFFWYPSKFPSRQTCFSLVSPQYLNYYL